MNCKETAWFCDRCDVRKEYSGGFSLVGGKCKPGGIGTSWEKLFDVFRSVYFHWGWYFWLLLIIPWIGVCRALPLLALVLVALLRAFKTNKQTNKLMCKTKKGWVLCRPQHRLVCTSPRHPRVGAVPPRPSAPPELRGCSVYLLVFLVLPLNVCTKLRVLNTVPLFQNKQG